MMPDGETGTADQAYRERNHAVLLLATLAERVGWPVYVDRMDTAWPIVYVESPAGQLSWHLPASEVVGDWDRPPPGYSWDGHTTEERLGREWDLVIYGKERGMPEKIRQRKEDALGFPKEDASERDATPQPGATPAPPRRHDVPPARQQRPHGARRVEPK